MIYNVDRHHRNIILAPDWRPVPIDHSLSFMTFKKPFRALYRFPREVIGRLRALDERTVKKTLGRYLKRDQISDSEDRWL